MPQRPADARLARGGGNARQGGDPPLRRRRGRHAALPRRDAAGRPAAQHQRRDARGLGGKLQPPSRRRRQVGDLAEHRGDAAVAVAVAAAAALPQRLLHRPQHIGVAPPPHDEEPRRVEAESGETGRVEVAADETPQHGAPDTAAGAGKPRQDAGREGGGDRAVLLVRPGARDLVQRARRQPPAGQHGVNRGDAERQHRTPGGDRGGAAAAGLQGPDPLTQSAALVVAQSRHIRSNARVFTLVLVLF